MKRLAKVEREIEEKLKKKAKRYHKFYPGEMVHVDTKFQKASASMSADSDMPSMGSIVNGGGSDGSEAGVAGSSPFAQTAGFSDSGEAGQGCRFSNAARVSGADDEDNRRKTGPRYPEQHETAKLRADHMVDISSRAIASMGVMKSSL